MHFYLVNTTSLVDLKIVHKRSADAIIEASNACFNEKQLPSIKKQTLVNTITVMWESPPGKNMNN